MVGGQGGYLQVGSTLGMETDWSGKEKIPKSGVANFGALAMEVKIWQIIDSPGFKEIDYYYYYYFIIILLLFYFF